MVDHVEFQRSALVDSFIGYWRQTGLQRFGYLIGTYERYDKVPLGIKAVVSVIYEPPQVCHSDGVQLEVEDPHRQAVDALANEFGLYVVGMIYSDLVDDGSGEGKVVCRRHLDSFFISSSECVFMARSQLHHPTPCKYTPADIGLFGSKFVTVVVSGDKENQIHLSSFQVSNTCTALVRDGIVEASTDPNLMRVQESREGHYVPEVFYKEKNEYGVTVQKRARPTFPVEYFLLTVCVL